MSQVEEPANLSYLDAIRSFQNLETLFQHSPINFALISFELSECYNKIGNIMSIETTNGFYIGALIQLKSQLMKLITIVQNVILSKNDTITEKCNRDKPESVFNIVKNTIEEPKVSGLSEIAGLCDVKKLLKSLVILPRKQPHLFQNRRIINSVLLFGPPGTGKTKLVHALASEANSVLYSVSVGNILSSFVGETEKTLQTLFTSIRSSNEFSILFIDEIDSISKKRQGSDQDYSRRIKTEFMCQMSKTENCSNMFIVCATNCPWDLDTAILRRFQKRIYIPLPNKWERLELLQLFTMNTEIEYSSEHWFSLLDKTEGYSGSDISDVVQHALNIPLTELEDTQVWKRCLDGFIEPIVSEDDLSHVLCCKLDELPHNSVRARKVNINDLISATETIRHTVSNSDVKKYEMFNSC